MHSEFPFEDTFDIDIERDSSSLLLFCREVAFSSARNFGRALSSCVSLTLNY